MCLYTKQICPAKARKDIVCYKIFFEGIRTCRTPVVGCTIENPHYTGVPFLMNDSDKLYQQKRSVQAYAKFYIGRGMIHAYQNVEYAKRSKKTFKLYAFLRIYKCIIPKGTLYFKGIDNDICAKQMLVIERV